jgi:hypothetical protein
MTDRDPTPTEWLVMEVLAARFRLGETTWHFPNTLKPTLKRLAERDWIAYKAAVVEGHQQAWLRTDGKLEWGLPTPWDALRADIEPFLIPVVDPPGVPLPGVPTMDLTEEGIALRSETTARVGELDSPLRRWWQWGRR